jgi:membrane protease YdiL (CAAX protease family)
MAVAPEKTYIIENRMEADGQRITSRKSLLIELSVVTLAALAVTRIFFSLQGISLIQWAMPLIVAVIFLYTPVFVLWFRKRKIDFLDKGIRGYARSFLYFIITAAIVFPPFLIGAHFWQLLVYKYHGFSLQGYPDFLNTMFFQLLVIALPEEFYFRGYFQSAMNAVFTKRWRILGADLGPGWLITAFVFAIAHSIVMYRWWHFAIFFPALLFGYLRERTGSIVAPTLFHASCNLMMDWFVRCYY